MTNTEIKQRDGDVMVSVTVKTEPATISFDEILESVEVEHDEHSEAPWESCDGYEHEVIDDNTDGNSAGSFRDSRGRMKRCVTDQFEAWGSAYRGASKQVVFEAHAREVKRTLEQLAKWHADGWEVWCVSCDFKGCSDSLCGVYDDDGDYVKEVSREIASNVADQLEKQGYTVTDRPVSTPYSQANRVKDHFTRCLANY